jgi:hypothetical protein
MEVNGQRKVPVALPPENELQFPFNRWLHGAQSPSRRDVKTEAPVANGNQTRDLPVIQTVTQSLCTTCFNM